MTIDANALYRITVDRDTLHEAIAALDHLARAKDAYGLTFSAIAHHDSAQQLRDAMTTAEAIGDVLPFVVDDDLVPLPGLGQ